MKTGALDFLAGYPPPVQTTGAQARKLILSVLPDCEEILDSPARIIAYGYGPGYSDTICTIIPSQKGLKVGILRAADLPDPDGVLEGTGKRHRYIDLKTNAAERLDPLKRMLRAALKAWKAKE